MRHIGTALAGNFALLVLLHAGETAQRSATLALVLLSHAVTSCLLLMRPESAKSTDWQRLGFPHSRVQGAAVWQGRAQAVPLHRRLAHTLASDWIGPGDWPGDWPVEWSEDWARGLGQGIGPGDWARGLGQGIGQRLVPRTGRGHAWGYAWARNWDPIADRGRPAVSIRSIAGRPLAIATPGL